jgi:hypothetical protein
MSCFSPDSANPYAPTLPGATPAPAASRGADDATEVVTGGGVAVAPREPRPAG